MCDRCDKANDYDRLRAEHDRLREGIEQLISDENEDQAFWGNARWRNRLRALVEPRLRDGGPSNA